MRRGGQEEEAEEEERKRKGRKRVDAARLKDFLPLFFSNLRREKKESELLQYPVCKIRMWIFHGREKEKKRREAKDGDADEDDEDERIIYTMEKKRVKQSYYSIILYSTNTMEETQEPFTLFTHSSNCRNLHFPRLTHMRASNQEKMFFYTTMVLHRVKRKGEKLCKHQSYNRGRREYTQFPEGWVKRISLLLA